MFKSLLLGFLKLDIWKMEENPKSKDLTPRGFRKGGSGGLKAFFKQPEHFPAGIGKPLDVME
jgi:hypothetical protein